LIRNTLYILIGFISISSVFGQKIDYKNDSVKNEQPQLSQFSDGPYIFIENNQLIEKTIMNGKVSSRVLKINSFDTIYSPDKSTFNNVEKIAALSDIHGQFDLAVEILKNNKIIDKDLNWNFDKGHLVITGDVFDRGNKVNEMLWLIYKLEAQAKNKGGKVHFLLGNHEYMILHKDFRYVNDQYKWSTELLNLKYDELYSNKTIIGRWLRSKATVIKINDHVFVHGGVSEDFITESDFNFEESNDIMRKSIDRTKEEMKSTNFYTTYYGTKSLIWYRGYFYDSLLDSDITKILERLESKHIIVGHCSNEEIVQLYNNKIFGVDSSIKNGEYGEILFIENDRFFRGTLDGNRLEF